MNRSEDQFPTVPDSGTRRDTVNHAHLNNADVKWSTTTETLHSGGSHVVANGPSQIAGSGKAGKVAEVLGHVKTVAKKYGNG